MWSDTRLPERLDPTDFAEERDRLAEAAGDDLVDLTQSNPTQLFPDHRQRMASAWRRAAAEAGERSYDPQPLGLPETREAIVDYYRTRGADLEPDQLVVTASTSEAYGWLAKVFADPGESILVPTPSYPLFGHLLGLEAVEVRRYPYRFDGRWHPDIGRLRRKLEVSPTPRALFAVSPNNPTGQVLRPDDWDRLGRLCAEFDVPRVVDEVFLDFGVEHRRPASVLGRVDGSSPLTVVLSGLSKTAALPGVKLGWMAVAGDSNRLDELRGRLAYISDTFLSASTASQLTAPRVLHQLDDFHRTVRERLRANLETLRTELDVLPAWETYPVEAGWYAVVRGPGFVDDRSLTLELLHDAALEVQPGFLYDLPDGHLVVSLLPALADFAEGVARLAAHLADISTDAE